MVRLITYMVVATAMILGIKALDSEAEMQASLMDVDVMAASELLEGAFMEDSNILEEDARKSRAAPKPARGKSRGSPTGGKKKPAPKDEEDDDDEEGDDEGGDDEGGEDEDAFSDINEVWELGADGAWVPVSLY